MKGGRGSGLGGGIVVRGGSRARTAGTAVALFEITFSCHCFTTVSEFPVSRVILWVRLADNLEGEREMASVDRRWFLKSAAMGGVVAPWGVGFAEDAVSEEVLTPLEFPDVRRGNVLRTSGVVGESRLAFHEDGRAIPVAGSSQVLVCGGGPAGIAAALASARAGADTQLLEFAGCLGGVWTAGLLTKILDASNKSGIMSELLEAFASRGSAVARDTTGTVYDPEVAKLVLEELCVDAGLKIQLHTMVVGAVVDESNRLVAVITESKSGRQAWLADRFIDCTGDGDLAAHAGCQFDVGIGGECECQPMSLMALVTGPAPEEVETFIRETGSAAKARLLKLMKGASINPSYRAPTLRHLHSGIFSLMTNHEYGVPAFDAGAVTQATIRARKEVHEIVNGLRQLGGVWRDLAVVTTAEQIGVREGRRVKGRHTITGDEIANGKSHSDAVCTARFPFDVHSLALSGNPQIVEDFRSRGAKPYDIPYRSLVAADVDGLLLAGRCISGDFIAHSSYRVTGNSVPMGEAAGMAAAVSIDRNVLPHELDWSNDRPA